MLYLLLLKCGNYKTAIRLLYQTHPEDKDSIWEYVEERIAKIERQMKEIIEHKPGEL